MRLAAIKRKRKPNLSATFRHGTLGLSGGGNITFDDALRLIGETVETAERRKARRNANPPTQKELFNQARFSAAARKHKVKMPVLSIQREEIDA